MYRTAVRKEVDAILKDAKGPDGKPMDLTDPVARHQFLSDERNANLKYRLTRAGVVAAFSEFIGSKAGALTGKITDVAAPGMSLFGKIGLENATGESAEGATKFIFDQIRK